MQDKYILLPVKRLKIKTLIKTVHEHIQKGFFPTMIKHHFLNYCHWGTVYKEQIQ